MQTILAKYLKVAAEAKATFLENWQYTYQF